MNLGKYVLDKLETLERGFGSNTPSSIMNRWKHDKNVDTYEQDVRRVNSVGADTRCPEDVMDCISHFENIVQKKSDQNNKLLPVDVYEMAREMRYAMSAVKKMSICLDFEDAEFSTIGEAEIDDMFDRMSRAYEKMKDVIRKKMYQDI